MATEAQIIANRRIAQKTTFYAKQSQIARSSNERNFCFDKGLWKLDTWWTWEKQSQNEPKQSQMQKSLNERKLSLNKAL